jgi:hypothetical protein
LLCIPPFTPAGWLNTNLGRCIVEFLYCLTLSKYADMRAALSRNERGKDGSSPDGSGNASARGAYSNTLTVCEIDVCI